MNQNKSNPINITAMRANGCTPDGKDVIISLKPSISPEQTYSVPVKCLYELIADLQRLNSGKEVTASTTREPAVAAPKSAKELNQIQITIPKKWMMRSGLPDRPLVIMIFDPQTETQTGFAISATAAREMAVGLVKYADSIAKFEANKKKLS